MKPKFTKFIVALMTAVLVIGSASTALAQVHRGAHEDDGGAGNTFMTDVVEGPGGFVGVGWAGGQAAMWVSPDANGSAWLHSTRISHPSSPHITATEMSRFPDYL